MNNKTVKEFNIKIKLRGDNVYDLYLDGEWVASSGDCYGIVDEVREAVKRSLYND